MNIVQLVREAGVVGAGGAGFPSHLKLDAKVTWFILNAAECEPLLRVDQQLCEKRAAEIVQLMEDVAEHLKAEHAVIAIKGKHKKAIAAMQKRCNLTQRVSIFELDDFYPAGDEQVLVAEVTGMVVPEMSIPLHVGCAVMNVETLLNVGEAIQGRSVIRTFVTLAGQVKTPVTLQLPIGITYGEALKYSGVQSFDKMVAIDGGPMMGHVVRDFSEPITKMTKGIILLSQDHPLIKRKTLTSNQAKRISKTACEQCRMCTDLCPRFLLGHNMQPHKMMRKLNYHYTCLDDATIAQLCCECNLCQLFACPVNLTPKSINFLYKEQLREKGMRHQPCGESKMRPMRAYRKTPVKRLIAKLGIQKYDTAAPLKSTSVEPKEVKILLKQHIGVPAIPLVSVSDLVELGQKIAEIPNNQMGAHVHASISGTVTYIDDTVIVISAK